MTKRLSIRKEGQGSTPLVLIPGWGMSCDIFYPLVPFLSNFFELFLVDFPGCGNSTWQADLTLEKIAASLVEEIQKPAVYLGWSLGSMVALSVAHDFKEQTLAYINVAGTPAFSQRFWPFGIRTDALEQFALQLQSNPAQVQRDFLALHLRNTEISAAEQQALAEQINAIQPDPAGLIATTHWLKEVDLRAAWQALTVPTLSILGDQDKLLPIAAAGALISLNPDAELHIMKKTSHTPFLHDKVGFSEMIIEFIQNHVL